MIRLWFPSAPMLIVSLALVSGCIQLCSTEATTPLEVIQAQVPPRTSFGDSVCQQKVFQHNFANSYGIPYVGIYTPPKDCLYTTTIFNISVTSTGRQYDRLALLFLGDTEVWRTSTAMPSESGIYWSYQKDMTIFDKLLRTEQKVIFSLDNVYSEVYTGAFNITLEALYYDDRYSNLDPADQVFPISALASSQNISSVLSLPDANATVSIQFPRNVKAATVSILASGNGAEEFWYTNVPSEYVNTFPENPGWLYGYSPFREIQLLIDGNLAGVSWPFPLLFTGGVDPGLWRPIVSIGAYDLPTSEIDVTPWLPLLCDGQPHTFVLQVVGFDSQTEGNIGVIGENWYVTGAVFIWLDEHSKQTTGTAVHSSTPPPSFNFHPEIITSVSNTTTNSSLYFELRAHRTLSISSTIHTSSGSKQVNWKQSMSFQNTQNMTASAFNQSLSMLTQGSNSDSTGHTTTYFYPINLYSAYVIAPSLATLSSVFTLIDRSLITKGIDIISYLTGINLGQSLQTRQLGISMYYWNETIVEGTAADVGVTEQWLSSSGIPGSGNGPKDFSWHLKEVNDSMVLDEKAWKTAEVPNTVPLPYMEGEPLV